MYKAIDLINELEKEFDINDLKINDIHVWPIIRISIEIKYYYINHQQNSQEEKIHSLDITNKVINWLKNLNYFWLSCLKEFENKSHIRHKSDAVFLTYTTDRNYIKGVWYDIFCDPIIEILEDLKLKSIVLELAPKAEYRLPRNYNSIFIQSLVYYFKIKARLLFFIHMIFRRSNSKETDFQNKLENLKEFVKVRKPYFTQFLPSWKEIKCNIETIFLLARFYEKLLGEISPKIGFLVCYYSCEGMAFNLACRKLGIRSVDLQHGLQGDLHVAYGRWENLPDNGYELLPSIFWCWSEYETHAIEKWARQINHHKAIIGGHPWVNKWLMKDYDLISSFQEQITYLKQLNTDSLYILFTLQPLTPPIQEWVLSVIQNSPSTWIWWIRLHPVMMEKREEIRHLLQNCQGVNIELDLPTDLPLPALLIHSDVHVTETSSTVIEAELFGVHSVVTHPQAIDLFSSQVDSSIVIYADSPANLIKSIKLQASRKRDYQNTHDNFTKNTICSLLSQSNSFL